MIDLEFSDPLEKVRSGIRNLAKGMLRPIARKYDEAEHAYPRELDAFRGISVMGGARKRRREGAPPQKDREKRDTGSNLTTVVAVEEMCWGDVGLLLSLPNAGLGNAAIAALATEAQLERFGGKWAAMAITEPGAGSDSGAIATTAELDGDAWVLNGEKIFVTCADRCDVVVVWATVDKAAGRAGIKAFVVEKGTPGLKLERLERKLGIRASDTGALVLHRCRIPRENLLGDPRVRQAEGFKGAMKTFDNTRPMVAAMANGVAGAAVDLARETLAEAGYPLDYSKNPANLTGAEKEFHWMEAHLEAMRLLTWRAAWMADHGEFNSLEASMCKAKAGRYATLITQKCCELLGPLGFSREHLAEKWMRDSKILDIFEGTGQIQHLIIARNVLNLSRNELK